MNGQLLYHYTTAETLELILNNRTIRFGRLDKTDDPDEEQTNDMGPFGRFCYVSCWTDKAEESIPMWHMYSSAMNGVRIGLPKMPFKIYHFEPHECYNDEPIDTYINLTERMNSGDLIIAPGFPVLIQVDYTEREELLYPRVHYVESNQSIEESGMENGLIRRSVHNSRKEFWRTDQVGEFKRRCWAFQSEWRYKIVVTPFSFAEIGQNPNLLSDADELNRRFSNVHYAPTKDGIDLTLDDGAFRNMEVIAGPRMADYQFNHLQKIMKLAGIDKPPKRSSLQIR